MFTHSDVKKAVIRSQHCQRNWDLSRDIPQEDIDLIIHSVTECPSKQNHAFYKVHVITDRNKIEQIHKNTEGFLLDNNEWTTNSQTLANLLLVFEGVETSEKHKQKNETYEGSSWSVERDTHMAVGVAAGYANLTASILGYGTGCCACFDENQIKTILGMKQNPVLLMGIGFKGIGKNRRIHHQTGQLFPTKKKEPITVERHQ